MPYRKFVSRLVSIILLTSCAARPSKEPAAKLSSQSGPEPGVFYVAPNGNDSWTGSLPELKSGTGPFATVDRALQAARDWKKKQGAVGQKPAAVFVRGGVYALDKPLVLTPDDSDLLVAAYLSEKPILSGGKSITGFKQVNLEGKTVWAVDLPEVREGKWVFRELWVNGRRASRARHPDKGYLAVESVPDKVKEWTEGQRRFRFKEGDLKPIKVFTNAEVI